jgi:hypothetical protein
MTLHMKERNMETRPKQYGPASGRVCSKLHVDRKFNLEVYKRKQPRNVLKHLKVLI